MGPQSRLAFAMLLASSFLWSQCFQSSAAAATAEDRLRAAILDTRVSAFDLNVNVKMTKDLPPLQLMRNGKVRTFRIFSRSGNTIDGANRFTGFKVSGPLGKTNALASLIFDNVKLVRFRSWAISAERSSVNMKHTFVTNCTTQQYGAVYVSAGNLLVEMSEFFGNVGGGISMLGDGQDLTVKDSRFRNNKAINNGGAIFVTFPIRVTIARTTFKGNSAMSGGAVGAYFQPPKPCVCAPGTCKCPKSVLKPTPLMIFDSCAFIANIARGGRKVAGVGGAIALNFVNDVTFIKPMFSSNKAAGVVNNINCDAPFPTKIRVPRGTITNILGNFVKL